MMEKPSVDEAKPLKISTPNEIKEWKKKTEGGEILELPSGLIVRIKRPKLAVMMKNGIIPSDLLNMSLDVTTGKTSSNPADIQKAIQVMEIILMNSFIEPRLVEKIAGEGEIALEDLTDDDRAFAFAFVQSGRTGLERFRKQ
jgi:hypothetical protein